MGVGETHGESSFDRDHEPGRAQRAVGLSSCLVNASSGIFHIPPYALANIPPMPDRLSGLPLNLILLLELPQRPVSGGTGVDAVLAFAASISARTVRFK